MEEKQIEKMNKYLNEEMEKVIFIMKGIESIDPLKFAFGVTHPAIHNFIEIALGSRAELLDIMRKIELNVDLEPKELMRSIHFLYEVFDATDEAYDVFLKIANNMKED